MATRPTQAPVMATKRNIRDFSRVLIPLDRRLPFSGSISLSPEEMHQTVTHPTTHQLFTSTRRWKVSELWLHGWTLSSITCGIAEYQWRCSMPWIIKYHIGTLMIACTDCPDINRWLEYLSRDLKKGLKRQICHMWLTKATFYVWHRSTVIRNTVHQNISW